MAWSWAAAAAGRPPPMAALRQMAGTQPLNRKITFPPSYLRSKQPLRITPSLLSYTFQLKLITNIPIIILERPMLYII